MGLDPGQTVENEQGKALAQVVILAREIDAFEERHANSPRRGGVGRRGGRRGARGGRGRRLTGRRRLRSRSRGRCRSASRKGMIERTSCGWGGRRGGLRHRLCREGAGAQEKEQTETDPFEPGGSPGFRHGPPNLSPSRQQTAHSRTLATFLTAETIRSGRKGLTMKSRAPYWIARMIYSCWPSAEHIMTRARGS